MEVQVFSTVTCIFDHTTYSTSVFQPLFQNANKTNFTQENMSSLAMFNCNKLKLLTFITKNVKITSIDRAILV